MKKILILFSFIICCTIMHAQRIQDVVKFDGQPVFRTGNQIFCGLTPQACITVFDPIYFPPPPSTPPSAPSKIKENEVMVVVHNSSGNEFFATKKGGFYESESKKITFEYLRPLSE